jgi:hypothetical protein
VSPVVGSEIFWHLDWKSGLIFEEIADRDGGNSTETGGRRSSTRGAEECG